MFQAYNTTTTTYTSGSPVTFTTTKFTDTRITASNSNTFTITSPGRYLVAFNGIGYSATEGSTFGVQLYNNGTSLGETATLTTSAVANAAGGLGFETIINVNRSCGCVNNNAVLQIVATEAGSVTNANLVIYKLK